MSEIRLIRELDRRYSNQCREEILRVLTFTANTSTEGAARIAAAPPVSRRVETARSGKTGNAPWTKRAAKTGGLRRKSDRESAHQKTAEEVAERLNPEEDRREDDRRSP